MVKVITYGTYDLLHYGHIRLLERAKALGDYLIVGVTADDFDKTRGKINIQQSLMERVEAIKATGIADEVIVEEYEGQKIDDIRRYGIDIFTVGSDWEGVFDYLKEYCNVIYLPRTTGVSSTELRSAQRRIKIGLVGEAGIVKKFYNECKYVNGIEVIGMCSLDKFLLDEFTDIKIKTNNYEELISAVDAVYIASNPTRHYEQIKYALEHNRHVVCESPIAMSEDEFDELFEMAKKNKCVLMDAIKTAYATAYARMMVLLKSGKIGKVISVDATCTSLRQIRTDDLEYMENTWNSICAWGPTAMLPIFQLLGTEYKKRNIVSSFADKDKTFDSFTKIDFLYDSAVASIKVGKGIKSEGELIVSGTKGYVYVPAPWWKMDYFEVRYEDQNDTKKYFYQLDGEGIRYEIVAFLKNICNNQSDKNIAVETSKKICRVISECHRKKNIEEIKV